MGDGVFPVATTRECTVDHPLSLLPLDILTILRKYGLKPDRRLGQVFLSDPNALLEVVRAAEIEPGDTVLEIGPGLGSLTRYLALQAVRVLAVELDGKLIPPLQRVLKPFSNVEIIPGDILEIDLSSLIPSDKYLVVANIPYYITSAFIRHIFGSGKPPQRLVLTLQREVADRICADSGEMSLLALSVQVYGRPRRIVQIPAEAFYPKPKVDSTVVRIDLYPAPVIDPNSLEIFFKLARAGFSQKRKTLRNSLSAGLGTSPDSVTQLLLESGLEPRRRAETLSLAEWGKLVKNYSRHSS